MRRAPLHLGLALAAALSGPALSAQTVTLAQAADSALAHHPTVAAARAAVDEARAGVDEARAARLPGVAASSRLTRFEEPMVVAPLHGFDPTAPPDFDETLIQSRVGLEYTLWDGGGRGARVRGARSGALGAEASLEGARAALLEATARVYLAVAAGREVLEAAELRVRALEAEEDRARMSVEEGTAARVELLRARAARADAQAEALSARTALFASEGRLARLTGVERGAVGGWALQTPEPSPAPPDGPIHDTAHLPLSPDARVRAAREAVAAAEARLAARQATRLPTLSGSAALVNYASGAGGSTTEWQAGLELSWPVFTGGARGAAVARAEAATQRAREELRLAELEQEDAFEEAAAGLAEARGRVSSLTASVEEWEEVARIERLRMEEGAGVQSDLLQAQARLFLARAGLARARHDAVLARVAAARAEGALTREWLDTELEMEP